jgi:proline dehydrogenase
MSIRLLTNGCFLSTKDFHSTKLDGSRLLIYLIGISMQIFNSMVARAIPFVPRTLIRRISRRYIAGDSLAQAIDRISQLNTLGLSVTIDVLGEIAKTSQDVRDAVDEYARVLDAIGARALIATISIKPTAFGLHFDSAACEDWIAHLAQLAELHKTSVCIDMEDLRCTQHELEMFERLRSRYANVSLALQAYLKRTYQDIDRLLKKQTSLRICKGIYVEDCAHLVDDAWKNRDAINRHFLHHVKSCFASNSFVAIATHDEHLIEQVIALAKYDGVAKTAFEFQMLLGVCEPLRDRLLSAGFPVRIYLPYGKDWYGYSTRRIKENPSIAGHILKALWHR